VHRLGPDRTLQVLLVHPGGPFWARRDLGAWSIPKGEHTEEENALAAARREFAEELGTDPPDGAVLSLGEVRQRGGKLVTAWALGGDVDTTAVVSNTVEMEWPRGSGRRITFPEIDRAEWFTIAAARARILEAQRHFLDRLVERLGDSSDQEAIADAPPSGLH